jgi:hypothetical protein
MGKNDSLFVESNECYQELFRYRLKPDHSFTFSEKQVSESVFT